MVHASSIFENILQKMFMILILKCLVPTCLFLRKFPSFSLLFSVGTGNKKGGQVWVQEMPDHSNWARAFVGNAWDGGHKRARGQFQAWVLLYPNTTNWYCSSILVVYVKFCYIILRVKYFYAILIDQYFTIFS